LRVLAGKNCFPRLNRTAPISALQFKPDPVSVAPFYSEVPNRRPHIMAPKNSISFSLFLISSLIIPQALITLSYPLDADLTLISIRIPGHSLPPRRLSLILHHIHRPTYRSFISHRQLHIIISIHSNFPSPTVEPCPADDVLHPSFVPQDSTSSLN
jgi:hypothetical protein